MYTLKFSSPNQFEIIANAFKLYQQHFWVAIGFSFPAALCFLTPSFLTGSNLSLMAKWDNSPLLFVFIIVGWLLGVVFQSALIFKLYCISNHSPCRWQSALLKAIYKLFSLLLLGALYTLMVLSGTMLLIIPGIILAFTLAFSFILLIVENQTVLQNLTISHNLVWNHWWYTVSILLFVFLIHVLAYMALFIVVFGLFQFDVQSGHTQALFFICNVVLQTLLIPFILSCAIVLLDDLRKRTPMKIHWDIF